MNADGGVNWQILPASGRDGMTKIVDRFGKKPDNHYYHWQVTYDYNPNPSQVNQK
jgi:hypothetical protein